MKSAVPTLLRQLADAIEREARQGAPLRLSDRYTQAARPAGVSRRRFLDVWRAAHADSADGVWCEGRTGCMTADAWAKLATTQRRAKLTAETAQPDSRQSRVLELLGVRRAS